MWLYHPVSSELGNTIQCVIMERISSRLRIILQSLATRVPRIRICRAEDIFPALKTSLVSALWSCLQQSKGNIFCLDPDHDYFDRAICAENLGSVFPWQKFHIKFYKQWKNFLRKCHSSWKYVLKKKTELLSWNIRVYYTNTCTVFFSSCSKHVFLT